MKMLSKLVYVACLVTLLVGVNVKSKTISVYFGNQHHMPYDLNRSALVSLTFDKAVFSSLLRVDSDFRLHPELLRRFYYDRKRRGYVLELAKNVEFQNGRKANSADLEFSLLRGFFSKRPNFFRVFLGNIKGATSRLHSPSQVNLSYRKCNTGRDDFGIILNECFTTYATT